MNFGLNERGRQKARFKFRLKLYAASFLASFLLIGVAYVFQETPLFKIQKFELIGAENLNRDWLLSQVKPVVYEHWLGYWLGPENFLSWSKKLEFSNNYIESAAISKKLFSRTVLVEVKERQPYLVWCKSSETNYNCFWLDKNGEAIASSPAGEGSLVISIKTEDGPEPVPGHAVFPEKIFANLKSILASLEAVSLKTNDLIYNDKLQELRALTNKGVLRFSVRFPFSQASLAALKDLINKNRAGFEYVDLTVEGRMFIK